MIFMPEFYYYTKTKGLGGKIKERIKDFKVREVTEQGKTCELWLNEESLDEFNEMNFPENTEERKFLYMEMQKFNLDMNESVRRIARFNGVSKKRITFAGVKDKRAITSQQICFFKPELSRLKEFKSKFIKLEKPEWKKEKLRIGMLKGNEFEITIRDIELNEKETEKRIKSVFLELEKGIPNYFGEQRFGGIRNVTHLVGKEFIKGNFENAVKMYLTYTNEKEEEEIRNARKELEKTNDFGKALKDFPQKFRYERGILNHLNVKNDDFIGAFRVLPKNLRYMFVHAYQSHVFNEAIKERIKYGLEKKDGDVLINGVPTGILPGFQSEFAEGIQGEIEKKIMEKEGIELKQFYVREMKEMSSKGARKEMVLFPEKLKLMETGKDEFSENKTKATISFYLTKGNYATTVLKEIMKE